MGERASIGLLPSPLFPYVFHDPTAALHSLVGGGGLALSPYLTNFFSSPSPKDAIGLMRHGKCGANGTSIDDLGIFLYVKFTITVKSYANLTNESDIKRVLPLSAAALCLVYGAKGQRMEWRWGEEKGQQTRIIVSTRVIARERRGKTERMGIFSTKTG